MDPKENPWIIKSSNLIYENPWISLTEHQVRNPGGKDGVYGIVHFKNIAIGIVPMDDQQNIWLVGQYRLPLGQYSWEIPEGGGSLEIDPLESAKRELLEETGLKAERWERIQEMSLSNSVSDERAIIYLARGLSQFEAEPEETEVLIVKKIPFDEACKMVLRGEIHDSISVAAILRVKIMIDRGEIS